MMWPKLFLASTWSVVIMQTSILAEVTIDRSELGAAIKIDGELFTEYLTKAGQAPAMWPVIGPTGQPMTRSYPKRAIIRIINRSGSRTIK
jgi:hypothetical protein